MLTAAATVPMPGAGVHAQGVRTTVRATVTARPPLNGACATLMNGPTELARTPEGMALLRFKRELEGVATVFEQRGAVVDGMDVRRMSEVQRGVDSLMRVFVRYRTADGSLGPTITVHRGDSNVVVNGKMIQSRALVESMDATLRGLRPNIEVTLRALEPQVAAFASAGARAVAKGSPAGYLGVSLSGSQIRIVSDSGIFTAHCDYPLIETVEVGSPARIAGLGAGDTIVAYNGRDVVAQAVNYPQLLVPGKVVRVRVRREGKVRDLPVTIATQTAEPSDAVEQQVRFIGLNPSPRMMLPFPFGPPWNLGDGVVMRMTPSPGVVSSSAGMLMVLGAHLNAVDDEFAQSLGLEPGVLVMRVQPGTPASEAGLRAGEVILAVNGSPVRELPPIQRAISAPGVRDVKLTVSGRDTPPRIVTIRW